MKNPSKQGHQLTGSPQTRRKEGKVQRLWDRRPRHLTEQQHVYQVRKGHKVRLFSTAGFLEKNQGRHSATAVQGRWLRINSQLAENQKQRPQNRENTNLTN